MKNFVKWVFMLSLCGFVGGCTPKKAPEQPQQKPIMKDMIDETDVYAVPLDTSEVEEEEDTQEANKIIQEEKALKKAKAKAQQAKQPAPAIKQQ